MEESIRLKWVKQAENPEGRFPLQWLSAYTPQLDIVVQTYHYLGMYMYFKNIFL